MNLRSTNARTIQDTFWKLETLKKKIPTARKFPPPHNFSSSPSLIQGFISGDT